jgi:uncharacterized membrane protein YbaN (DUF454 family)
MAGPFYLAGGLICVALGAIGDFLPVLPTVPFLLLAIFCFARSKPEWVERLYAHPVHGPALRQWRDRRAISRKAKNSALIAMAFSAAVSWAAIGWPWAAAVTAALLGIGTWLATRPDR